MELSSLYQKIRNSLTLKLIFIAFLLLLLHIPVLMLYGLIRERTEALKKTEQELGKGWGQSQIVSGLYLAIPQEKEINGKKITEILYQLPEKLSVETILEPEIRYRGIYKVVLYAAKVKVKARFRYNIPATAAASPLDNARICIGIQDIIGIRKAEIKIGHSDLKPEPGIPYRQLDAAGIHAVLPAKIGETGAFEAEAELLLNGSKSFAVRPLGQETVITISSSWKDPSFLGPMLPNQRKITPAGFTATWNYTALNRNFPQQWIGSRYSIAGTEIGVNLKLITDIYTQVERAVKYVTLFMIFVLLFFLAGERMAGVWMHPFQYLLSGLAILLFYLLLLSISEHLFFDTAFAIAAVSVSVMVAIYIGAIFRSIRAALGEGAAMLGAYGVIYLLLKLENAALLVGSCVLFILLALLMTITANLNKSTEA